MYLNFGRFYHETVIILTHKVGVSLHRAIILAVWLGKLEKQVYVMYVCVEINQSKMRGKMGVASG